MQGTSKRANGEQNIAVNTKQKGGAIGVTATVGPGAHATSKSKHQAKGWSTDDIEQGAKKVLKAKYHIQVSPFQLVFSSALGFGSEVQD